MNNCKEELNKKDINDYVIKLIKRCDYKNDIMSEISKKRIYTLILVTIIIGGLVPFAAQFILPFFFSESRIAGAEIWNQYVSIILGIVATITSIVSLILSLRSEEQAYETERRTRDLLKDILREIVTMSYKQDEMNRQLYSGKSDYNEKKKEVNINLGNGKIVNTRNGEDDTIVE